MQAGPRCQVIWDAACQFARTNEWMKPVNLLQLVLLGDMRRSDFHCTPENMQCIIAARQSQSQIAGQYILLGNLWSSQLC